MIIYRADFELPTSKHPVMITGRELVTFHAPWTCCGKTRAAQPSASHWTVFQMIHAHMGVCHGIRPFRPMDFPKCGQYMTSAQIFSISDSGLAQHTDVF